MTDSTIFAKKIIVDGQEVVPSLPSVQQGVPLLEFETATDITLTAAECTYQVVDKSVTFQIFFAWSALGTSSGDLAVQLPPEVLGVFNGQLQECYARGAYDYSTPAEGEYARCGTTRLIRLEHGIQNTRTPTTAATMQPSGELIISGTFFLA